VTTVWNGAGGTGSAGGTVSPGGPATLNITLNVIPASTTFTIGSAPALLPVPAGSVSGCTAPGNPGLGPAAGAIIGCVTGIIAGGTNPAHGTLATSGNTLRYTPNAGYIGTDTFTYEAVGVNTDGSSALESGPVTVFLTVSGSNTPLPPTWSLLLLGIAIVGIFKSLRRMRRAPQR